MANIRKRGRRYQVQVRRKGHPSTTRRFARLEEAKAWARKQEIALDRHETGIYAPPEIMLLEILKRYRDEITPLKKSRDSETRRLNRLLRDPISNYRVCALSSEIMVGFRDTRLMPSVVSSGGCMSVINPSSLYFKSANNCPIIHVS